MARKQTAIADQATDFSDPAQWPPRVMDYDTAQAILLQLWSADRPYSVQDLTTLSQARFEVSRQRRLPGYYLQTLAKMQRRWNVKDASRAHGQSFPVPGHYSTESAGQTPLDDTDAIMAQRAALDAEAATAPAFTVRRP